MLISEVSQWKAFTKNIYIYIPSTHSSQVLWQNFRGVLCETPEHSTTMYLNIFTFTLMSLDITKTWIIGRMLPLSIPATPGIPILSSALLWQSVSRPFLSAVYALGVHSVGLCCVHFKLLFPNLVPTVWDIGPPYTPEVLVPSVRYMAAYSWGSGAYSVRYSAPCGWLCLPPGVLKLCSTSTLAHMPQW